MHTVSALFEELYNGLHTVKPVVELQTVQNGETVYVELEADKLYSVKTSGALFPDRSPSIGNFCAREVDIVMIPPTGATIPRMARLRLFVYLTDGERVSERVPKGVFWIDTRSYNKGKTKLSLHAYDAALKFDADFDASTLEWPAKAEQVVVVLAQSVGVNIREGVLDYIANTFVDRDVPLMPNLTKREIMCGIAAMFCANWTISDEGTLDLVPLNTTPEIADIIYLADELSNRITIGGDTIIVR